MAQNYSKTDAETLIKTLLGLDTLPPDLDTALELSKANESYRPYAIMAAVYRSQPELIKVDNFTFQPGSLEAKIDFWRSLQRELDRTLTGIPPAWVIDAPMTFITAPTSSDETCLYVP